MRQPILLLLCILLLATTAPEPTLHPRPTKDHALFFAIQDYDNWTDLKNPIRDAEAIAQQLRTNYGFDDIKIITNPTLETILATLNQYLSKTYGPDDQLFIYFSGHGEFIDLSKEGFFIPKGAIKNDLYQSSYLPLTRLERIISTIPCAHILLTIDACYSGTFNESIALDKSDPTNPPWLRPGIDPGNGAAKAAWIATKLAKRSRLCITSGGKERTSDGIEHSPLTEAFLKELSNPGEDAILTVEELIAGLKNTQPEPKAFTFGTHQLDGNFLFILNQSEKKANPNPDEIDRVIESSLIEAEHLIRNLDYDRAWYRLKGVKDLKKPQQEITKLLLEIAFWNAESSKYDRAEEILRAIADPSLLSNSPILDSLRFSSNFEPTARLFYLRRLIRSLDKIHFEQLLNRYYPTMIRVKGGEFQVGNVMGDNAIKILRAGKVSENSYRIDSTRLRDTLYRFSVRDFELAKTETTIWQWSIFCASTGKNVIQYVNPGSTDSGNLPAAKLSWHEAVEYANWLSGRWPLNAPIAPFFKINGSEVDTTYKSKGFRLPTEEEWVDALGEG